MPKKLHGAALAAHQKKHPKKHAKKHAKKAKKSHAKKPKKHHGRKACKVCGHRAPHTKSGCTHFASGQFCSCRG